MVESPKSILVFGHPGCPMVYPVRRLLDEQAIPYTYINIHQDLEGRLRVKEINRGYESVPTLVFPDGSTLTEPSLNTLRKRLQAQGLLDPEDDGSDGLFSAASRHPLILPLALLAAAAAAVALLSWLS